MPGSVGGGHSGSFSGAPSGTVGSGNTGSFVTAPSNTPVNAFHTLSGESRRSGGSRFGSFFRSGSRGCSGLALLLFLLPILLIFGVLTLGQNVRAYFSEKPSGYQYVENFVPVMEKLPGKEKLDASKCSPVAEWMEIHISGYLSESDDQVLKNALRYFYEKTGVQPYFILTNDVEGSDYPNEDEVSDYLTKKYTALFGEDEGHYILLMVMNTENGTYSSWYIPGLDAETVIDADGSDILLSYIDSNAAAGYSLAESVGSALRETADGVIDGVTVTRYEDHGEFVYETEEKNFSKMFISASVLVLLTVAVVITAVIIIGRYRKKRRMIATESDYRRDLYEDPADGGQNSIGTNTPVTCPSCGATAYPDDRGCCQFCGAPLRF